MSTVPILNSSESVEWFTPAPYVEAARNVLGSIELDPASCTEANAVVKADRWFGENAAGLELNGLQQSWIANTVFLNPPYGHDGQRAWSARLLDFYQRAMVGSAVLLVNAATSEKWFHPLWHFPICFPDHRIKFDYPKLRRFPLSAILGDKEAFDKLAKVPITVWIEKRHGWLSHTGAVTKDPDRARVYTLADAWKFVRERRNDDPIYFDRQDKPCQPTKGQAFVFLPNIEVVRRGLTTAKWADLPAPGIDTWLNDPSIAAFIGNFAQFGHIYMPSTLLLQVREAARARKEVADAA
jgi:hypothetical protein